MSTIPFFRETPQAIPRRHTAWSGIGTTPSYQKGKGQEERNKRKKEALEYKDDSLFCPQWNE